MQILDGNKSVFSQYPLEENETKEKWRVRVEPLLEEDLIRKEGETVEDHLKRMFELKNDAKEMAPDILKAICEAFGARVPSDEEIKKTSWLQLKEFIYNTLSPLGISCGDYFTSQA